MTRDPVALPVTVVIPAFNDQSGVERCLNALGEGTYPYAAIEVIVVDNGSVPPLSIVEPYPFTVKLLSCFTPGSYAARNAGIACSSGQVFAFIDADCWPDENWLYNGVRSLTRSDGNAIVGGDVRFVKPAKPSAAALYQCMTGFGQESNIRRGGFSATANLFCSRQQFEATGPFDSRLLSGGDREWCWRARKRGIHVQFEPSAIVNTCPRANLSGSIRQARRVAAGRLQLRKLGLAHIGDEAISNRRSTWQSVLWVCRHNHLSRWDRFRVLFAATLIYATATLERWRLALGAKAERR
jgi:glycosyltransferase involved in cell wall biosynthesis